MWLIITYLIKLLQRQNPFLKDIFKSITMQFFNWLIFEKLITYANLGWDWGRRWGICFVNFKRVDRRRRSRWRCTEEMGNAFLTSVPFLGNLDQGPFSLIAVGELHLGNFFLGKLCRKFQKNQVGPFIKRILKKNKMWLLINHTFQGLCYSLSK